jgi:hypothetical protein
MNVMHLKAKIHRVTSFISYNNMAGVRNYWHMRVDEISLLAKRIRNTIRRSTDVEIKGAI